MSPTLNLTDYEEPKGFDALPAGKYFATVFDAEDRETAGGENAKMPAGTPMIFLHFMITGKVAEAEQGEDSPYYNRRAFRNMVVPPDDYDPKKAKAMRGMIVSFYRAVGYTDEEITSGDFDADTEDQIEKDLVIQLDRKKKKEYDEETGKWVATNEFENNVVGFFTVEAAAGSEAAAASSIL